MNRSELESFYEQYRESPQPEKAPEAIRSIIEFGLATAENSSWYFFARIAKDNPKLIRKYEELFRTVPAGRPFLLLILTQAGDEQTREFLEAAVLDRTFAPSWPMIDGALKAGSLAQIRPLEPRQAIPWERRQRTHAMQFVALIEPDKSVSC